MLLVYMLDTYVYTKYDPAFLRGWCVYEVDFFENFSFCYALYECWPDGGIHGAHAENMPANILAQGTIFDPLRQGMFGCILLCVCK